MTGETIARNYADALFALGTREGAVEDFGAALDLVAQLLESEPRFRTFLDTPRVGVDAKKTVLRESLGDRVPALVLNFVFLVMDRRRQRLLPRMAVEYRALVDEQMGRAHVEVSVARELGDGELDQIRQELSRILNREAIPHVRVRPELVGGIAFRSGDTIFDGSVRRRLQRMRRTLMTTDVSTDQG